MRSKQIINAINGIVCSLVELGLASDKNYTGIRKTKEGDTVISVSEKPGVSFLRCESYSALYHEVEDRRAFDFKLLDGALISMCYVLRRNDTLKSHRLAFLPSPQLPQFQDYQTQYIGDVPYIDVVGPQVKPVPLRFDFDIDNARPITHPASHLTIGQYSNCRIPVSAPVEPAEFTTFIIRHFYDSPSLDNSSKINVKKMRLFDSTITPEESEIPHLRLRHS